MRRHICYQDLYDLIASFEIKTPQLFYRWFQQFYRLDQLYFLEYKFASMATRLHYRHTSKQPKNEHADDCPCALFLRRMHMDEDIRYAFVKCEEQPSLSVIPMRDLCHKTMFNEYVNTHSCSNQVDDLFCEDVDGDSDGFMYELWQNKRNIYEWLNVIQCVLLFCVLPQQINRSFLNRLLPPYYQTTTPIEYLQTLLKYHTCDTETVFREDYRGFTPFVMPPTRETANNNDDVMQQPNYRGYRFLINKYNLNGSCRLLNQHGEIVSFRKFLCQIDANGASETVTLYEIFRTWPIFCGEFMIVVYRERNAERKPESCMNESCTIRFILLDLYTFDGDSLLRRYTYSQRYELMANLLARLPPLKWNIKYRASSKVSEIVMIRRPLIEVMLIPIIHDIHLIYAEYEQSLQRRQTVWINGIVYRDANAYFPRRFIAKRKFAVNYVITSVNSQLLRPLTIVTVHAETLYHSHALTSGYYLLLSDNTLCKFSSKFYRVYRLVDSYFRGLHYATARVTIDNESFACLVVKVYQNEDHLLHLEVRPDRSMLDI
jgi:hypothetical protein